MKYLQFGQKENPGLRLVFLHGYGASAQDLSDFRHLSLPVSSHWIFPEGPLESALAQGGRAWFPLKLHLSSPPRGSVVSKLLSHIYRKSTTDRTVPQPLSPPTRRSVVSKLLSHIYRKSTTDRTVPQPLSPPTRGIHESSEVLAYLEKHVQEIQNLIASFSPENLVLGGFSQGAVMALHVALRMKKAPLALVFLSGAFFPDKLLEGQKQSFCQGGRFFQAHGQEDSLLSFAEAKKVEDFLIGLNWKGQFVRFGGGHEIPPLVLSQMSDFLKSLFLRQS